nr:hypothetical protein [uncultured Draconibacterium sp.]
MRTQNISLSLFIIVIIFIGCQENKEIYYFNNFSGIFKKDTLGTILSYSIIKPVYSSWDDSSKIEISNKGYFLMHHFKQNEEHSKDTVLIRSGSFLDSIDFYDYSWVEREENLEEFWNSLDYINNGQSDELEIYIIEPKEMSDSITLKRVHRFFMPGREGLQQ